MHRVLSVACAVAVLAIAGAPTSPARANTITPTCSPSPTDCSGPWYKANVSLSWTVDPGPANSAGCDPQLITQTSASGDTVTCSADWTDGDPPSGSPSVTIKVDTTDPTVDGANASRPADSDGWFNHTVSFDFFGSDTPSGIDSCSTGVSYSGPDSATASVSGTCTDVAGNSHQAPHAFKYDATKPTADPPVPTRGADHNGWYNHTLTFAVTGSDLTSGVANCTSPPGYGGPDSAAATVSGHCTDNAGNVGDDVSSAPFRYDDIKPATTGATPDRGPDQNGWYNHPLTINLTGTDNLSNFAGGSASNCGSTSYVGPDAAGTHATGACTDQAGNTDGTPLDSSPFNYDATPPAVTGATPDRGADSNGWYNHPVSFNFHGSDATSGIAGCSSGVVYGGPNGTGASVTGSCQDNAGNTGVGAAGLRYDGTPPRVLGALPDRLPDHSGWFNHPVKLSFQGVDSTSGIAACSRYTYNGPQNGNTLVRGTCTDAAGNSTTASFPMHFDATPPAPAQVAATPENGKALITWTKPPDAVQVRVLRSIQGRASSSASKAVYKGAGTSFLDKHLRNGRHYLYTVVVIDQAGNHTSSTAGVSPTSLSLRPFPGALVSLPPKLTWKQVKHARYYNVQLYLGRVKVLSTWPKTDSLQLQQSWLYAGHSYSLVPGTVYTWYVWPGIGPRSDNRYGHLLGKSTFTVVG